MKVRWLRIGLISLAMGTGVSILVLVGYSYFFLDQNAPLRTRGETAVNTSQLILTTSQGQFLSKDEVLDPNLEPAPVLGRLAPDIQLDDLNGFPRALSQFRGKPVLLNFWATWCPPCRKEMPDLQAFDQKHGDKVQLLGINWDFVKQDALDFLDEFDINYPNLYDEAGKAFVQYRLTGLPVTFWIDEAGFIRGVWFGAMTEEEIITGFETITDVFDDNRNE
jgi:thiol-disulfide isomerase/thioredoxin